MIYFLSFSNDTITLILSYDCQYWLSRRSTWGSQYFNSSLSISISPALKDSDLTDWHEAEYFVPNSLGGYNVKVTGLICSLTTDLSFHFSVLLLLFPINISQSSLLFSNLSPNSQEHQELRRQLSTSEQAEHIDKG